MSGKYIVVNENTLGYLIRKCDMSGEYYQVGILRASILKGSPYNEMSGMPPITSKDFRPATKEDFEEYRVSLPPDF